MSLPILPHPPQPGWLRVCPRCLRWLALRLVEQREDVAVGHLRVYRCTRCGEETWFAWRHPPGAM